MDTTKGKKSNKRVTKRIPLRKTKSIDYTKQPVESYAPVTTNFAKKSVEWRSADTAGSLLSFSVKPTINTKSSSILSHHPISNQKDDQPPIDTMWIITRLKKQLKDRGAKGIIGLGRKFKIMDDDGSKTLCLHEFKKAMKEMDIELSDRDLRLLFEYFDKDESGSINFEEFMQGLRDPMNERRLRLVKQAFGILDKDGSLVVTIDEIRNSYDASKHPDVVAGKRSETEILNEFLQAFEVGETKDGCVTAEEFENYYHNLSASIEKDDYFELMIRNAWHISGGEGQCANSSNRRVLVTHEDGSQTVEEIQNDIGITKDDSKGMHKRLKESGIQNCKKIELTNSMDTTKGKKSNKTRPAIRSSREKKISSRSSNPKRIDPKLSNKKRIESNSTNSQRTKKNTMQKQSRRNSTVISKSNSLVSSR